MMTQLSECLKSESFLHPERVSSLGSRRQGPGRHLRVCVSRLRASALLPRGCVHTSGEVGSGELGGRRQTQLDPLSPQPQGRQHGESAAHPTPHLTTPPSPLGPPQNAVPGTSASLSLEKGTLLLFLQPLAACAGMSATPAPTQSWESQQQDGAGRQAQGPQGLSSTSQAQGQGAATMPGPPTWPRSPKGGNYPSSLRKGARSLTPQ